MMTMMRALGWIDWSDREELGDGGLGDKTLALKRSCVTTPAKKNRMMTR